MGSGSRLDLDSGSVWALAWLGCHNMYISRGPKRL